MADPRSGHDHVCTLTRRGENDHSLHGPRVHGAFTVGGLGARDRMCGGNAVLLSGELGSATITPTEWANHGNTRGSPSYGLRTPERLSSPPSLRVRGRRHANIGREMNGCSGGLRHLHAQRAAPRAAGRRCARLKIP